MIFLEFEGLLKSEFEMSLNELIYKADQNKREYVFQRLITLTSNLVENNHFNKVIKYFSKKGDVNSLYNYLRYYLEFPIFTAEERDDKIISDYHYISDDVPLELLDVSEELNIEFDFQQLEIKENSLMMKGFAFIPFINMEKKEDIKKKLILVSEGKKREYELENIETEETLDQGNGIYYYQYAGFEKSISLNETESSLTCFLELTKKNGVKYEKYCFDIVNQQIQIDTQKRRSELNPIIREVTEPELLFVEDEQNINISLKIDDNLINSLLHSSNNIPSIQFGDSVLNYKDIIEKNVVINNITYLNQPLLRFEINPSLLTNQGKSYIVFTYNNKRQDIKYTKDQHAVLDKLKCDETGLYVSIFSNKKNNIELHVQDKQQLQQTPGTLKNMVKFIRKVKRRLS
ncbi:hypothetical protein [Metabacillus arenae]|uniref:Uncharacterized protein n=1 Tax=Metabacillus arenae TaxID=2771434 RepID=A0A926NIH8_9BACI|nr:hypothetical protein [Metabacillus arenae]MBD1381375.1 hypothetical protein [Metabacillus arenae]